MSHTQKTGESSSKVNKQPVQKKKIPNEAVETADKSKQREGGQEDGPKDEPPPLIYSDDNKKD